MKSKWRRSTFVAAGISAHALAVPARAATVIVAGTTDIFLASQPSGNGVSGFFGSDTAPANSPVQLGVVAGATVSFSASGSASVDASCFAGPDGGCYDDESGFSPAPASNTYKGPATALIGVFLDNSVIDVASGIASLDYTDPSNRNLASYAPSLGQIFFIGDGLTDASLVQGYLAPTGATRLFLAVADSFGSSTGNVGAFSVGFTGATAAVPEPATWSTMLGGFILAGGVLRRRRAKACVA